MWASIPGTGVLKHEGQVMYGIETQESLGITCALWGQWLGTDVPLRWCDEVRDWLQEPSSAGPWELTLTDSLPSSAAACLTRLFLLANDILKGSYA